MKYHFFASVIAVATTNALRLTSEDSDAPLLINTTNLEVGEPDDTQVVVNMVTPGNTTPDDQVDMTFNPAYDHDSRQIVANNDGVDYDTENWDDD